jgi:hypothetical protein
MHLFEKVIQSVKQTDMQNMYLIGSTLNIVGSTYNTIGILLLPLAIRYGITFQSHPRFCRSQAVNILTRAPYEAVQQWMTVYETQAEEDGLLCPISYILNRSREECQQIIVLMKEYIKRGRGIPIYSSELQTLSDIVHEVPSIVLDTLRHGLNIHSVDFPRIVERAQHRIDVCRSSLMEHMILPVASIVIEYIG